MSTENFEQFYTDLLTALRVSLTQVSGDAWTPPPPMDETKKAKIAKLLAKLPPEQRGMIPLNPKTSELQEIRDLLPPHQPSYTGFQLVDIARLGTFALIAFRWRETGDEIFVYTIDLHPFAAGQYGVETSEAIISMNLLEQLGGQWHTPHTLRNIKGLSFLE